MPNVLILPQSAEYSEEVWMEIREKALSILHSFFLDGVVPNNAVSDEDEKSDTVYVDDQSENQLKGNSMQICRHEQQTCESHSIPSNQKFGIHQVKESQVSGLSQNVSSRPEGRHNRSGKKGKKRPARRRSRQKSNDFSGVESSSNYASNRDDDTALSGRDQVLSSNSRFASPEDSRNKHLGAFESTLESTPEKPVTGPSRRSGELLKDGYVIALHARDRPRLHVSRQRVAGGGWFLDTLSNVTRRDPAAQFLVDFTSKVCIYL